MKKLIIIALAALPFLGMAQDKGTTGTTTAVPTKQNDNKFAIANPEVIFVELIVSNNSAGVQMIKADFGREIVAALTDKELAKQLTEMRTMTFPSVPDAMNFMSSQGYKFQQNYVTYDKEGKADTHFVYEKRMARKQGVDPNAKPRPERPEGKPATDVNTKEKPPVTRPEEKGRK